MLKNILIIIVFLISIFTVSASYVNVYDINLHYENGNFELNNFGINVVEAYNQYSGNYYAKIISFNNSTIGRYNFSVSLNTYIDSFDENGTAIDGGVLTSNSSEINLKLPYYENAKEIVIYDINNKEKLRIDVSMYSKTKCGDGICSNSENYVICNKDCESGSKDNYCDELKDNTCDSDCKNNEDSDCLTQVEEEPSMEEQLKYKLGKNWIFIVVGVLIFIIIGWIITRKKHK